MARANNSSLEAWIAGTAAGDADAFSRLYQETGAAVYAYALSILRNRYDAEDILHECYIAIRDKGSQYRPDTNPMAWIMTVTRNLCLQHLQRQKRSAQLEEICVADTSPDPDDKLIVEGCLRILSDEERQIVVLHTVAGFKHREIGAFMSLPVHTVITKYRRALRKMRDEF